jgi:hypothetical protein
MDTSSMLKQISVCPDDLFLDPNNPRLVQDLNFGAKVPDAEVPGRQQRIRDLFAKRSHAEGDEFFDITDLYDSMIRIGYVGIDRIVVREFDRGMYLVVEGNRRVSTIKLIRERAKKMELKEAELEKYKEVSKSFESLEVLLLKTSGLSSQEIDERISVILGLRHFGSVLDWKPINRAYNAYQNYMQVDPPLNTFVFDNKRVVDVASRLSVSRSEVKKALQTYLAYRQLGEIDHAVEADHYSLIEAGIGLGRFGYLHSDPSSFSLDDASASKLIELCQFDRRKDEKGEGTLIISEPKKFNVLGKILKISIDHENETIRQRARELVAAVERGELDEETGQLVMDVDKALSLLTAEIYRREWVASVTELLDRQGRELPVSAYDGEGNHLLAKEELEKAIVHLRTIFGV